ncbi:SusC/RagA family TonB-linked outer membrane protein [Mucilaginibacter sp. Bleaf8]|uniref:SusC/RagA family TonB-linked outer membrane protein n=1 Tax=Mucilaginibacter sp. Bleaf8 TaxID=2834430 RepID=UPI001BCBB70B|nr:SusC/RagA family TonB-linked outer membrane protein [Mucilaginibacter sp. Bleaf8]MBS7566761.1 SusC/RagA family TonB-linked outer membrane protein [Mucilaginibacter sp. Bleaf8]
MKKSLRNIKLPHWKKPATFLLAGLLNHQVQAATISEKFPHFNPLEQQQQAISISGKITDEKGEAIPGVNVTEKGTTNGTQTDINGEYRLNVSSSSSVLVISFVGYQTQEITPGNRTSINVRLVQDLKSLKEVVVVSVGYGTLDKREVSSAITHVGGKELLTVASNSPLQALQGKVAGLTVTNTATGDPNSVPSVQLRGVSSRNAGLGPLYIVNGVIGANVDNINQNDIESIDVLKGGAASAIYGTRGGNGVIIITTKKGTSESRLFYDGYSSFDYITNKYNVLSKDAFVQNRVNNNQGNDYGGSTDWLKEVSKSPAFGQKHTVQISGGSNEANFFASADYRNADGIDLRANKKEYGTRINANFKSKNGVYSATLSAAPRYAQTRRADYSGFNYALTLNPTFPIYGDNGQYNFINNGFFSNNPVENARLVRDEQELKKLDLSGVFKVNILKNLYTTATLSESSSSVKNLAFQPSTLSTIVRNDPKYKRNYAQQEQEENDVKNFEWTGNYSLNIKKHDIKLLGGYAYSFYTYEQFRARNYDIPFDEFLWNNLGSGSYNGGGEGFGQDAVGSTKNSSTLIAFFGRVNYSYDNKYILTASLRHEGSSKFGFDNKWGNFPAVSAAWRVTEESFLKNKFSWLNDLKVRADYGVTGNQNFDNYKSLLLYGPFGFYSYNGNYYQVYGPSQNVNPNLRWEKAINFNAGFDFEILNGKLSGSVNYYVRTNKDLLGDYRVPLPPNAQEFTYANVGTLKNSGLEIQLYSALIKKKDFSYSLTFAGAYNNNKFVSFSNDLYKGAPYLDVAGLPGPGSPGNIQRLQEGRRIGSFYMYKNAGVDANGSLLVYKKDGSIVPANQANNDDKQFVGNGLPKYTASLGNTFTYKKFDLSIFLRGNFGYQVFNTPAFYLGTPATQIDANVLTSAYNSGSKYSKLTNGATVAIPSDYFLESGDFVKIDNVSLGYTQKINSKFIHGIRLYAAGRNLHTFKKLSIGDPDLIPVNGLTPGLQLDGNGNGTLNYYPSTLQVIMGAQVTF